MSTTIGYAPGIGRQQHVRAAQAQFPALTWYGHRSHLRCYLHGGHGDSTLRVEPPTMTRPYWQVWSLDVLTVTVKPSCSPDLAVALAEFSGKLATYYATASQAWRGL